jgi:DNA polymerase I-like protein with 3'-5' exonuclease and polymerase domains
MAQVPASHSPYGHECRSCWTVPEGKKLVGFDASGLELRMLAHYMNDKEFTNVLLTEDIHTRNQLAAGLETRPQAKTFIYAFLYGAGDAKIGTIVGGSAKDGVYETALLEHLGEAISQDLMDADFEFDLNMLH